MEPALKSKKILVTGGAGFIGSNLCEYLLKQGHEVICLDNFFTGKKENIEHLKENSKFSVIEHDVIEPIDLEGVEQIYNLACPASPPHYQFDKIKTVKANVMGSINMLELALKSNARILQASTSEIYGDPLVHPQTEKYRGNVNTMGPRSCYDEGKRVAETLFNDYHVEKGVDVRIVRIFNTYGPNMDIGDGRVVSNFIIQCLQGKDITIYGNGEQTRSFQYITDLLDAMYKMMMQDEFMGPVNLGNPVEFSIKELASKVIELTKSNSKLVFKNLPQDDPLRRKPDISLAKEKLDWEPKVHLEEGLVSAIEYFKEALEKK